MKKIFLVSVAMMPFIAYAQSGRVGVNTAMPNATLDVTANAADPTIADGVIPPQLTRQQLINKTAYGTSQKGAMVYVTDLSGTTNIPTAKVDKAGFYYWDGAAWQKVGGNDWSLSGNAGTTAGTNFLGTTDSQGLTLKTNGKLAMGIDTNQFVGIGTQNPLARFHIYSQNPGTPPGFANDMVFEYADGGTGTDDPFTLLYLRNGGTPTTPMNLRTGMTMMSNWIGTYVNGNRVPMAGISSIYRGNGTTTASDYNISVSGYVNNSFYIKENQNIGIGNNDPAERLDVNGNIKVRGTGSPITDGATCTNAGTISYSTDGNFYGCTGANIWKKLNN